MITKIDILNIASKSKTYEFLFEINNNKNIDISLADEIVYIDKSFLLVKRGNIVGTLSINKIDGKVNRSPTQIGAIVLNVGITAFIDVFTGIVKVVAIAHEFILGVKV